MIYDNSHTSTSLMSSSSGSTAKDYAQIESRVVNELSALVVQQRQILGMLGLDIWIPRECDTVRVDYENFAEHYEKNIKVKANSIDLQADISLTSADVKPTVKQLSDNLAIQNSSAITDQDQIFNINSEQNLDKQNLDKSALNVNQIQALRRNFQVPKEPIFEAQTVHSKTVESQTANSLVDKTQSVEKKANLAESLEQVAPFEIVGAQYKDWVLIVDVSIFKDQQALTLWENILLALSVTAQGLKFPICQGISDKESANASVAGFVFSLSKNNEAKVAALTPLPHSVEHPKLIKLPYLIEMLSDSALKKQLWHTLNQN
ncbi:hypothetical protein [Psychrobacter sp.]|uniref:hypothetical protein n=1 Tax=Psychrobacter sp. TaxID=56811 RepID=UPI0025F0D1F9|nr:hypothetical protein [Psychrobacter sp.]